MQTHYEPKDEYPLRHSESGQLKYPQKNLTQ